MLTTSKLSKIKKACQEYVSTGGFPETQHLDNKREYIKSVYEKVLLGDIVEREQVKNKMALRLMIKKIAETVMHEISFNTLAGNVKATGVKTSTDSMIE
jgi:predicted AAA+ superfamily ATPase